MADQFTLQFKTDMMRDPANSDLIPEDRFQNDAAAAMAYVSDVKHDLKIVFQLAQIIDALTAEMFHAIEQAGVPDDILYLANDAATNAMRSKDYLSLATTILWRMENAWDKHLNNQL